MNRDLIRSAAIWFVVIPVVHGLVPWMLSLLTYRFGWKDHAPGYLNWLGLAFIGASVALLIYAFWWRRRPAPAPAAYNLNPAGEEGYLMRGGPYQYSRNPIYLGYLGSCFGWSIFFGSASVFTGFVVLCVIAGKVIVPTEERDLMSRFGDAYIDYNTRVPRWLGIKSF